MMVPLEFEKPLDVEHTFVDPGHFSIFQAPLREWRRRRMALEELPRNRWSLPIEPELGLQAQQLLVAPLVGGVASILWGGRRCSQWLQRKPKWQWLVGLLRAAPEENSHHHHDAYSASDQRSRGAR